MAGTGAIQIAASMLAGNRAGVYASALLVAYKFRKAFTASRCATEAIAAIIWRAVRTIRHTVSTVRIRVIALTALLNALIINAGAIATHRHLLVRLKEYGTTEIFDIFYGQLAALCALLTAARVDRDSDAFD